MRKSISLLLTIIGIALAGAGLWLVKSAALEGGTLMALPYILIGVGCGAFGHGTGELLGNKAMESSPQLQKQMEIEKNDERNVEIANKSKGKAYNAMIYIYGAMMVSFSLMNVPMYVILMLVFAYLLVVGISIYYRSKYEKEM